jgi:hypothetical protein
MNKLPAGPLEAGQGEGEGKREREREREREEREGTEEKKWEE